MMEMQTANGSMLIQELLSNPHAFFERGLAYDLLQEYFHGLPVDTLGPLIRNPNAMVQRSAVWIGAELGAQAKPILSDAIALVSSSERYLVYYALEIVAVCSTDSLSREFVNVLKKLNDADSTIRKHAMRLVANAEDEQLKACISLLESLSPTESHDQGLKLLTRGALRAREVLRAIESGDPTKRAYGAIAARRLFSDSPSLLIRAAESRDRDVREFARSGLEDLES